LLGYRPGGFDYLRSRATSKQSRKKSALILASQFGALFDYGTLLLSFFYFKMGANELVTSYFGLRAPIANFKAAQGVEDWLDVRVGELQMTLQNSSPALVVGMCVCSENE
jgi:hypothetical protein